MRRSIRDLVSIVSKLVPAEAPIYEFGSYQVQPPSLSDMRQFFPGIHYIGCDARPGRGVDRIVDLHELDLKDDEVPTILCLETIEHVERPWIALDECFRVLKPGGFMLLTTVFAFPIHDHPADFWRFTPECIAKLLAAFEFLPFQSGSPVNPHTVGALAWKPPMPNLGKFDVNQLSARLMSWSNRWATVED
jgi:SAM-dependent methyltransferase